MQIVMVVETLRPPVGRRIGGLSDSGTGALLERV